MRLAASGVAFIAFCSVITSHRALAQTAPSPSPSPSASAALTEIGRVVTSDRRDEPVSRTSRPTFVVDRARIDALGARTVAAALADVPGFTSYTYGGFGSLVNYGIRGSNSEQTLVLIDGQPITSADSGQAYLESLTTLGINRIEVVESGSSTLYGTSASGGVINIITSVPRTEYLSVAAGSYADRDVRVEVGNGAIGGGFERHVVSDAYGYPALAYNAAHSFPAGTRDNAYADQTAGRVFVDEPLGSGFAIHGHADDTSIVEGVPGSVSFLTPGTTQKLTNQTGNLRISHASARSTISLDVSGARQLLVYGDPSFGADDSYTGRAQISLKDAMTFGGGDLVTGVDLSRESGVFAFPSAPIYNDDFTAVIGTAPPFAVGAAQAQSAAYAQAGVDVARALRVVAGLRAEHDAPQGSVLAPSFGGVLRSGAMRLTGNLGESFRVPTLDDLYYPMYGNPNLRPEKAATADATIAYDGAAGSLSAGWFSRSGSNFIVTSAATNFIPYNARTATSQGVQLTARTRPVHGIVFDASFTDLYLSLDRSTGARLPESPVGNATLGFTRIAHGDRLSYGARWHVVGSDGDDAGQPGNTPLISSYDAFNSLDAFLRYEIAPHAVFSLRGFNLGDDRAAPIYGYPNPGRRIYVEFATR